MKGINFKKLLPYAGAILAFVIIAYAFTPEILSGKIVNQSDISSWQGMANEITKYNSKINSKAKSSRKKEDKS